MIIESVLSTGNQPKTHPPFLLNHPPSSAKRLRDGRRPTVFRPLVLSTGPGQAIAFTWFDGCSQPDRAKRNTMTRGTVAGGCQSVFEFPAAGVVNFQTPPASRRPPLPESLDSVFEIQPARVDVLGTPQRQNHEGITPTSQKLDPPCQPRTPPARIMRFCF